MIKVYLLLAIALPLTCLAQQGVASKRVEDSLRQELKKANLSLETTRKEKDRLIYLLTAKEMAVRSVELKDSVLQGLIAVQAFNFTRNHEGNTNDIDISRALYLALQKLDEPIATTSPKNPTNTDKKLPQTEMAMAKKLCSRIGRNMSIDEWNRYARYLKYEKTCDVVLDNKSCTAIHLTAPSKYEYFLLRNSGSPRPKLHRGSHLRWAGGDDG